MKKFLIFIYVLIVATLSISARANTDIPLLLNSIQLDREAQVIQIDGYFPNPCVGNPTPQLYKDDSGQLIFDVTGKATAEVCIAIVGPRFMLAVELNVLKSELSRLELDENGTYKIFDRRGNVIAEIDFSEIFYAIPLNTTNIHGFLSKEQDSLYLLEPHGQRIKIVSPLINLESLRDADVTLIGHMIKHSVSQPFINSDKPVLQFIATGVSFTAAN